MSGEFQRPIKRFASDAEAAKWVGQDKAGKGLQKTLYAGKAKLLGDCLTAGFEKAHLAQANLVGFGEKKDRVEKPMLNKLLVPHVEEAFHRIRALNLPYVLKSVNGYMLRYAKTMDNARALMGRPEYAAEAKDPTWGTQWNVLCAQSDVRQRRFDDFVPERHKPKHDMLSNHSYGSAFDINAGSNPFALEPFDMPIEIVRLFDDMGFYWGGRYHDYMHFEWVDSSPPSGSRAISLTSGVRFPLGQSNNQSFLKYFALNENGDGGFFPVGMQHNIHGGIHLDPWVATKNDKGEIVFPGWQGGSCEVVSCLPGYVVAARGFPEPGCDDPDLRAATEGRPLGFVLVRHELYDPPPPAKDGEKQETGPKEEKPPQTFPLYSLYMHLAPPAMSAEPGASAPWLANLLGMQFGCVVHLDPKSANRQVGDVSWLASKAEEGATEVNVVGSKDPIKLAGPDGALLGVIKPCPEEVGKALEAFKRGAVITFESPLLPVSAGDILGSVTPTSGKGYLHWEVFSLDNDKSGIGFLRKERSDAAAKVFVTFRDVKEAIKEDNYLEMPHAMGGKNEIAEVFGDSGIDVKDLTDELYPPALQAYMKNPAKFGAPTKVGKKGTAVFPLTLTLQSDPNVPLKALADGAPFRATVKYLRNGIEFFHEDVTVGEKSTTLELEVPVEADEVALLSDDLFFDLPIPAPKAEAAETAKRFKIIEGAATGRYRNLHLTHINEWTPEGLRAQLETRCKEGKLGELTKFAPPSDVDIDALAKKFRPITWWGRKKSEEDPAGEVPILGEGGKEVSLFGTSGEGHLLPKDAKVQCIHPVVAAALMQHLLSRKLIAVKTDYMPATLSKAQDPSSPPLLAAVSASWPPSLGQAIHAVLVQHGYGSETNTSAATAVTFALKSQDGKPDFPLGVDAYMQGVATTAVALRAWGKWELEAYEASTKLLNPQKKHQCVFEVPEPKILEGSMRITAAEGGAYTATMVVQGSRPRSLVGYAVLDWLVAEDGVLPEQPVFKPGEIAVPVEFTSHGEDEERQAGGLIFRVDAIVGRVNKKEKPKVSKSFTFQDFWKTPGGKQVFALLDESKFRLLIPLLDRLEELKKICTYPPDKGRPVRMRVCSLGDRGNRATVEPVSTVDNERFAQFAKGLPATSIFEDSVTPQPPSGPTQLTIVCLLADGDALCSATLMPQKAIGSIGEDALSEKDQRLFVRPSFHFTNGGWRHGTGENVTANASTLAERSLSKPLVIVTNAVLGPVALFEFGKIEVSFAARTVTAVVELLGDLAAWRRAKPVFAMKVWDDETESGQIVGEKLVGSWSPLKKTDSLSRLIDKAISLTAKVKQGDTLPAIPPTAEATFKVSPSLDSFDYALSPGFVTFKGKASSMPTDLPFEVVCESRGDDGAWEVTPTNVRYVLNSKPPGFGRLSDRGLFNATVERSHFQIDKQYRFSWTAAHREHNGPNHKGQSWQDDISPKQIEIAGSLIGLVTSARSHHPLSKGPQ